MDEKTHLQAFADFVMSDDDSELGKMKAERNYALHCLEREIAICAQTQKRNDVLVEALEYLRDNPGMLQSRVVAVARVALETIKERA